MDSIRYFLAQSGDFSVEISAHRLHSTYNPRQEARRFIEQVVRNVKNKVKKLFIIGSGLGYIEEFLSQELDFHHFLSYDFLEYEHAVYHHKFYLPLVRTPAHQQEFKQVLQKIIREDNFLDFEFVIWVPARHIFIKEITLIEEHLRQIASSLRSAEHFGARWVRNAFLNTLSWKEQLVENSITKPIVVVAAGVSLLSSIELLRKRRLNYYMIALSSSLYTLESFGLEPDMVINLDGGYYAKAYLDKINQGRTRLVSASLGAWHAASGVMVGLGSFIDRALERLLGHYLQLGWAGTVSYSAIELALMLTSREVVLVGQDFEVINGLTHAKPHRHYDNMLIHAQRVSPVMSAYYPLVEHSKSTLPMYAQWFVTRGWSSRVRRLFPSSVDIGIRAITDNDFLALTATQDMQQSTLRTVTSPGYDLRKDALKQLLRVWQGDWQLLAAEVMPMVFAEWQSQVACGEATLAKQHQQELEHHTYQLLNQLLRYLTYR